MLPAQKRPLRSTLPSLRRLSGRSASGFWMISNRPVAGRHADAVVGAGDEAVAGTRRQRPDAERRLPLLQLAPLIEPENLPALDIDPVERRFARDPHRPLAEHCVDVGDAMDIRFGSHLRRDSLVRPKEKLWDPCRPDGNFGPMGRRMRMAEGFIAVDWGTTNRRAYGIDGEGRRAEEFEDSRGVLSVPTGAFPEAVAEIRARLGDKPLLLAGMIGSNRGWIEAPYVPCPAGLDDLARGLVWADDRTAIVPGVCDRRPRRRDARRGGAAARRASPREWSHPTASSAIRARTTNGRCSPAARSHVFRTVMTGELFNLLKEHSILADLSDDRSSSATRSSAGSGTRLEREGFRPSCSRFAPRVLLGKAGKRGRRVLHQRAADRRRCPDRADTGRPARRSSSSGRPELTRLYAAALAEAGREAVEIDGEQCFLAGIHANRGEHRMTLTEEFRTYLDAARWSASSAASRPTRPRRSARRSSTPASASSRCR